MAGNKKAKKIKGTLSVKHFKPDPDIDRNRSSAQKVKDRKRAEREEGVI